MKFLINVLPNNIFTEDNVRQFILNIESQHNSNVSLVFKKVPSLTSSIIDFIKASDVDTLVVDDYAEIHLDNNQQNYWINLHVTDCLLPNAITQWEQVIDRHSSDVIELTYLHNETSLIKQTEKVINKINQKYPVRLNTVKAVLHLPLNVPLFNLSLSSQLLILLGLQNYKVMDTIQRYSELNNVYLGTNFLIHCTPVMVADFKNGLINTLVNVVINRPEIVKINLPTVILSRFSLKNRIEWLSEVGNAANYIDDAVLLNQYQKFVNDQITHVKKEIFHSKNSRFIKHHLMSKVSRIGRVLLQTK